MKSKTIRILSLATAASMLFSATAFASAAIDCKYNIIDDGEAVVAVDLNGDTYPSSEVNVQKGSDDRYKVTIIGDVDVETDTRSMEAVVGIWADADVSTENISFKTTSNGEYAVLAVVGDSNIKTGDINAEMDTESGTYSILYGAFTRSGTDANIDGGNVTVTSKNKGYMAAGTFIGSGGTYSFKDVRAEATATAVAAYVFGENGMEIEYNAENLTAVTTNGGEDLTGTSGLAIGGYGEPGEVTANITGNITGSDAGILVSADDDQVVTVNCLGTVSGEKGAIAYQCASDSMKLTLNLWKLESEDGIFLDSDVDSAETFENDEDELAKVNYILKTNGENCTIVLSAVEGELGSTGDAFEEEYKTQNEEKQVIINVKAADGYEVSGLKAGTNTDGEEIQAVKNTDGTWTVIVPRGGGVDITPILKAIAAQEETVRKEWTNDKNGKWQYYKANGALAANEWQLIAGKDGKTAWYHFDKDGAMNTGWYTDENDGYTYYLDPVTGKMATGHAVIDGKEYYFNETVNEESGWKQNSNGKWIYSRQEVLPLGALIG